MFLQQENLSPNVFHDFLQYLENIVKVCLRVFCTIAIFFTFVPHPHNIFTPVLHRHKIFYILKNSVKILKILYTETGNDVIKAAPLRNQEYMKENICNGG